MKYPKLDLGQIEATVNKLGGMEGLEAFLRGELKVVRKPEACVLELVSTTSGEGADSFVASDHFKIGETEGVKISFLGDNFKANFLGKVEKGVSKADLRIHRLKKGSRDSGIIMELGGEDVVETTLAHMWTMLMRQGNGESGQLLTDGSWNVFYIRDASGVLWAVHAAWFSFNQCWAIEARSLEHPHEWLAGRQVISR